MPAELAIRIKDKNSLDPEKDRVLGKEGDIIVAIHDERIKQVWTEMICRGRWDFSLDQALLDEYMKATNNRRKRLTTKELDIFWDTYVVPSGLLAGLGKDPTDNRPLWQTWPWGTMETKHYFCIYIFAATKANCAEWIKPIQEQIGIAPNGEPIMKTLAKRQYKVDFRGKATEMGLSAKTLADIDNPDLDVFTKFDISDYKQFVESKI